MSLLTTGVITESVMTGIVANKKSFVTFKCDHYIQVTVMDRWPLQVLL